MGYLEDYLAIRRAYWPYDDNYRIITFGEHGFAARIGDVTAGLAWADLTGTEAVMHMKLKPEYSEYGIGTELLHKLMNNLIDSGAVVIRYTITPDHWAYQIYEHLGFEIENRTQDEIQFIRRIQPDVIA